jgi:hypothetical protein
LVPKGGAVQVEESRSDWKPSTRQQHEPVLRSQLLPLFGEASLLRRSVLDRRAP